MWLIRRRVKLEKVNDMLSIKILYILIILIDTAVPLIIWPRGQDYFYYPKIITIYGILAVSVLVLVFSIIKRKIKLKITNTIIIAGFYVSWAFLSAILSKYRTQSFWGSNLRCEGAVAMGAYFLILYLSFLCCDYKVNLNIIFVLILISGSMISIYALLQYFGIDIVPRDYIRERWVYISFSTLGNPDFLGSYLCLIFPLPLCYYLTCKKNKTILIALNILLFSAIVCTRARSTWLGAAVSILFIIFIVVRKDSEKIKRIVFLGFLLAAVAVILDQVHNNLIFTKLHMFVSDFKNIVERDNMLHAGSQRLFIWERTLRYVFKSPITGSGPDTFGRVFKMTRQEAMQYFNAYNIYVDKAHNEFLQIIVTMGFPSLFFYLTLLIMAARRGYKKIMSDRDNIALISVYTGVLSYVVQSFFNISVVSVAPLYWSMLGFLISLSDPPSQI